MPLPEGIDEEAMRRRFAIDPRHIAAVIPYGGRTDLCQAALEAHRSQVDPEHPLWKMFRFMRTVEGAGEAYRLAGFGSLIPAHKTYIQQRHVYDGQCKAAGLSNMHGLRHRYAQMRYEVLTERKALAAGGPGKAQLNSSQRLSDQHARQQISRELGHERLKVTSIYLGS